MESSFSEGCGTGPRTRLGELRMSWLLDNSGVSTRQVTLSKGYFIYCAQGNNREKGEYIFPTLDPGRPTLHT